MSSEPIDDTAAGTAGAGGTTGPDGVTGVHRLFEQHARRAPGAVAVRVGDQQLTYGELDARANRLARHLAEAGLAPGGLAAVSMGREPDVLVAVLAVLKAGGAYLPLEPSGPDPLLRHVLAGAAPAVVVTHESHRVRLADAAGCPVVCLDTAAEAIAARPGDPLPHRGAVTDLACVVYTSGSTGLPKGVMIEHRGLLNAWRAWHEVYGLSPADRILQSATLEFDVFTADWVRALCSGATLVMTRRNFALDRTADIAELPALVAAEAITVLELNLHNAARLHAHLRATPGSPGLPGVRLLTVGAEKWYLDDQLALQQLLGPEVRVLNVYGAAEACIDSSYFDTRFLDSPEPEPGRRSLIGRPFPGTRLYLLGPDGLPLPDGNTRTAGEIAIGGAGVGPGYLGRLSSTNARFRSAAFDPDDRIYLTGDLGRRRPDGLLEFVGRAHGFTGGAAAAAAESVLRTHPQVERCLVAEVEVKPGEWVVVAYVVPADEAADRWTLSAFLRTKLPRSPVRAVVLLPSLPRTRAGKPDLRALPLPAPADHAAEPALPGQRSGKGGAGGKSGGYRPNGGEPVPAVQWAVGGCFTVVFAVIAALLTLVLFPGSTDLSGVPLEWAGWFRILYVCEYLSFGAGVVVLVAGWPAISRLNRPRLLSRMAHLSLVWLLAAWWPQDNLYRISSPTDWPRQALLVYTFNVPLMVAALVLTRFVTWSPRQADRSRN